MVTGNGQEDPGLFLTHIAHNIADPRYLPFENAGAISTWQIDLPASTNGNNPNLSVDLTQVDDIYLHLFYTALYGGSGFQKAASKPAG